MDGWGTREGEYDGRGSRSVTYSTVTYGDESNVKPMIVDVEKTQRVPTKSHSKDTVAQK